MNAPEVKKLYQDFIQKSGSTLSHEQFFTLLLFFPALLVVVSDGQIDHEEWTYIKYLAKFMSDAHIETLQDEQRPILTQAYSDALKWLVENLATSKKPFIETLAGYLNRHPEVKEDIIETLYMFSEASDGQSQEETQAIDRIKQELGID